MNIAQRATSVAGLTTSGHYTADRWFRQLNVAGTFTDSVQTLSASDAPMADGVRRSLKTTCTTASGGLGAGAYSTITQSFEGINTQQFSKGTASAKFFALSFWVRSNVVGTYLAELYDLNNSRTVSASYSVTASGAWQKVRLIFPADSIGVLNNDTNASLQVNFWLGAGSNFSSSPLQTSWATVGVRRATGQVNVGVAVNNYFEITAVQLEPNAVCTPFEVEDIQTTLAKCQRYFYKMTGYGFDDGLCQGHYYGAQQLWCVVQHPVQMRGAPSFGLANGVYNAYAVSVGNPVTTAAQYSGTPQTSTIYFTTLNARTLGVGGWIATGSGFFTMNADI
jgi:hypothetical protein